MFIEVHCIARGKVQGVGYRDFVQSAAKEHAIFGSVANMSDGSVEVIAQGTPDDLKAFVIDLQEGSVLARIDAMQIEWRAPTQRFDDFVVTY